MLTGSDNTFTKEVGETLWFWASWFGAFLKRQQVEKNSSGSFANWKSLLFHRLSQRRCLPVNPLWMKPFCMQRWVLCSWKWDWRAGCCFSFQETRNVRSLSRPSYCSTFVHPTLVPWTCRRVSVRSSSAVFPVPLFKECSICFSLLMSFCTILKVP